jgi:hypothetical protein
LIVLDRFFVSIRFAMINVNDSLNIASHLADIPPNFLADPVNSLTGAAYFMNAASGSFAGAPDYLIAAFDSVASMSDYLIAAFDSVAGAPDYRIAAFDSVVAVHSNWTVCSLSLMIDAASQTACTDFGDVCHDFGTP